MSNEYAIRLDAKIERLEDELRFAIEERDKLRSEVELWKDNAMDEPRYCYLCERKDEIARQALKGDS